MMSGGNAMKRITTPTLPLTTLVIGLAVGWTIARVGPTGPTRAVAAPRAADPASPAPAEASKPVGDAATYDELARQYDRFRDIDRTFSLVSRAVAPSVVHIVARKPGRPDDDNQRLPFEETGSGVIVRPDAGQGLFILTNNHVVEGAAADAVTITLHDGRALQPRRFWTDPKADVAVIDIGRDDLPAARIGDSDETPVGTWVLALGSPFGLTHSVSQGIISARNRHEAELEDDGVENQAFIQTDAAINPGNSGGPLVNMRGEVVGINTAIASNGGGSEGVGFSIPINLARWIMNQLVTTGRVSRGAMGVTLANVDARRAAVLGLGAPHGAVVSAVHAGSPAATAGLRDGDVILKYNGVDVIDLNHLINLVSMSPIGRKADIVLWRGGRSATFQVGVADRDAVLATAPAAPAVRPGAPLRRPARPPAPDPSSAGSGATNP